MMTRSESAVRSQQSAISNQQSAISNQQSAISNQQSAISNQQSAISNQQSAISNQTHSPVRPLPSFRTWKRSTARFSQLSSSPFGHRTSMRSMRVASETPKC